MLIINNATKVNETGNIRMISIMYLLFLEAYVIFKVMIHIDMKSGIIIYCFKFARGI